MKKGISGLIALFTCLQFFGQPPAGDANPGDWYGKKITSEGAVPLASLAGGLQETMPIQARMKAKVLEVCPKKGCWLKLQVTDSTTAMVKMKDYGFFLPLAAKGKSIVVEGEMQLKVIPVDELRHYAADARKSKEEIDSITKPEKEIRITASGILIVD